VSRAEPAVSIIARTYNDQRNLPRTLRSLLTQTLPGLEIVVVDEGSADRSYELALELQKQHPGRIRLHRQQKTGSAAAWNQGIALARGKYIGFADANGWAEPEMAAALCKACEGNAADICISPYFKGNRTARDFGSSHRVWDQQECREELLPKAMLNYKDLALWDKLIRRDFLLRSGLRIPEEDGQETFFLLRCLAGCECLVTLARPFYHLSKGWVRRSDLPIRTLRLTQYGQLTALRQETGIDTDENRRLFCTEWMDTLLEICVEECRISRNEAAFYRSMISLADESQIIEILACAERAALSRKQRKCYDAFQARDWAKLRKLMRAFTRKFSFAKLVEK